MLADDSSSSLQRLEQEGWIEVHGPDRWAMYSRLQALQINCRCRMGQPLQVQLLSVQDLIQCWSVARHSCWGASSKGQLVAWLTQCWEIEA